ncbi:MAG: DNA translocase FtsK 4TM domain-containing protein, partial [Planctomycetales bacterium]
MTVALSATGDFMLDSRIWKARVATLGVLALTLFLALSLLTYDAGDPPSRLVAPRNAETQNACGAAGALTAYLLFESVGLAAYFLLFSLGVVCALALRGKNPEDLTLRAVGWIVAAVAVTSLSSLIIPVWGGGPVIGPGGYLGVMVAALLHSQFAWGGSMLLAGSALAAGLLLAADGAVFHAIIQPFGPLARVASRLAPSAWKWKQSQASDAANQGPSKRKRPKKTTDLPALGESLVVGESPGESPADSADPTSKKQKPKNRKSDNRKPENRKSDDTAPDEELESPEESREPVRINKPPTRSERQAVMDELDAASRNSSDEADYELPSLDLLLESEDVCYEEHEKDVREKARILERTFQDFGLNIRVVEIDTGPVIAQFEVELEAGLRLSKITGLADDLAIALRVENVRIVAPIPGKNTVGVEVPNADRRLVRMREVMEETDFSFNKMQLPIFLGKDVSGKPLTCDLAKMPHLLIAGRTGTGQSVCLNTIIASLLMTRRPDEVKMLLIDPKMVELSCYRRIPHLMHPVVVDMKKAEAILAWAVEKMEERYAMLARAGVRHLSVYNQLGEEELRRRMDPESDEEWNE